MIVEDVTEYVNVARSRRRTVIDPSLAPEGAVYAVTRPEKNTGRGDGVNRISWAVVGSALVAITLA
jgi:hypothetical protein